MAFVYVDKEEDLPAVLICTVCHDLAGTHRACPGCGNTFCEHCVFTWFNTQRGTGSACSCPYCRRKLRFSDLRHDAAIQAQLDSLRVRCPNAPAGCGQVLRRADVPAHLAHECAAQPCTCSFCGAGGLSRAAASQHEAAECPRRPVPCPHAAAGCNARVPLNALHAHLGGCCQFEPRPCARCSQQVVRADWAAHLQHGCPEAQPCPLRLYGCSFSGSAEQVQQHAGACTYREKQQQLAAAAAAGAGSGPAAAAVAADPGELPSSCVVDAATEFGAPRKVIQACQALELLRGAIPAAVLPGSRAPDGWLVARGAEVVAAAGPAALVVQTPPRRVPSGAAAAAAAGGGAGPAPGAWLAAGVSPIEGLALGLPGCFGALGLEGVDASVEACWRILQNLAMLTVLATGADSTTNFALDAARNDVLNVARPSSFLLYTTLCRAWMTVTLALGHLQQQQPPQQQQQQAGSGAAASSGRRQQLQGGRRSSSGGGGGSDDGGGGGDDDSVPGLQRGLYDDEQDDLEMWIEEQQQRQLLRAVAVAALPLVRLVLGLGGPGQMPGCVAQLHELTVLADSALLRLAAVTTGDSSSSNASGQRQQEQQQQQQQALSDSELLECLLTGSSSSGSAVQTAAPAPAAAADDSGQAATPSGEAPAPSAAAEPPPGAAAADAAGGSRSSGASASTPARPGVLTGWSALFTRSGNARGQPGTPAAAAAAAAAPSTPASAPRPAPAARSGSGSGSGGATTPHQAAGMGGSSLRRGQRSQQRPPSAAAALPAAGAALAERDHASALRLLKRVGCSSHLKQARRGHVPEPLLGLTPLQALEVGSALLLMHHLRGSHVETTLIPEVNVHLVDGYRAYWGPSVLGCARAWLGARAALPWQTVAVANDMLDAVAKRLLEVLGQGFYDADQQRVPMSPQLAAAAVQLVLPRGLVPACLEHLAHLSSVWRDVECDDLSQVTWAALTQQLGLTIELDKLVAMVDNNLPVVEEPEEYSDEEDMDMDAEYEEEDDYEDDNEDYTTDSSGEYTTDDDEQQQQQVPLTGARMFGWGGSSGAAAAATPGAARGGARAAAPQEPAAETPTAPRAGAATGSAAVGTAAAAAGTPAAAAAAAAADQEMEDEDEDGDFSPDEYEDGSEDEDEDGSGWESADTDEIVAIVTDQQDATPRQRRRRRRVAPASPPPQQEQQQQQQQQQQQAPPARQLRPRRQGGGAAVAASAASPQQATPAAATPATGQRRRRLSSDREQSPAGLPWRQQLVANLQQLAADAAGRPQLQHDILRDAATLASWAGPGVEQAWGVDSAAAETQQQQQPAASSSAVADNAPGAQQQQQQQQAVAATVGSMQPGTAQHHHQQQQPQQPQGQAPLGQQQDDKEHGDVVTHGVVLLAGAMELVLRRLLEGAAAVAAQQAACDAAAAAGSRVQGAPAAADAADSRVLMVTPRHLLLAADADAELRALLLEKEYAATGPGTVAAAWAGVVPRVHRALLPEPAAEPLTGWLLQLAAGRLLAPRVWMAAGGSWDGGSGRVPFPADLRMYCGRVWRASVGAEEGSATCCFLAGWQCADCAEATAASAASGLECQLAQCAAIMPQLAVVQPGASGAGASWRLTSEQLQALGEATRMYHLQQPWWYEEDAAGSSSSSRGSLAPAAHARLSQLDGLLQPLRDVVALREMQLQQRASAPVWPAEAFEQLAHDVLDDVLDGQAATRGLRQRLQRLAVGGAASVSAQLQDSRAPSGAGGTGADGDDAGAAGGMDIDDEALEVLAAAAEDFLVQQLGAANEAALHAGRQELQPADLRHALLAGGYGHLLLPQGGDGAGGGSSGYVSSLM